MTKPVILPGDDDPRIAELDVMLDGAVARMAHKFPDRSFLDMLDLAKPLAILLRKMAIGAMEANVPADKLMRGTAMMISAGLEEQSGLIGPLIKFLGQQMEASKLMARENSKRSPQ